MFEIILVGSISNCTHKEYQMIFTEFITCLQEYDGKTVVPIFVNNTPAVD